MRSSGTSSRAPCSARSAAEPPAAARAGGALARLLRPRSLAVLGGREAEEVALQCDRMGFAGPLWPVNPGRATIAGRRCLAAVADLPEPPDAAFLAVPAEATIAAVRELAAIGAGGAVCYASGFTEVGAAGRERQRRLVEAAGAMPILGPNCHGALNYLDGVALWPDQHGGARVERGAAILTQSGNMGLNLTMQRRSLSLAYLVSLGNQAALGIEDCVAALLDDDRVSAIGLHIEGLADIANFERAALGALDRGVPLVALKVGQSEAGARLALSHTASLAGVDALYDALFRRLGVARVHTVPEFLETLKFLSVCGPLAGNRLASMSCSGGEASLVADLASGRALVFPEPTPEHRAAVAATLNDYVEVSNPLDYHTFIWGREPALAACFTAMLGGGFDLGMLVLDFPRADRCRQDDWWTTARAFADAAAATGARAAVVASLAECLPEDAGAALAARGIAPMQGIAEALTAFEAAARIGAAQAAPRPAPLLGAGPRGGTPRTYDEWDAKAILRRLGIAVPEGRIAQNAEQAVAAAAALGPPVALKALSAALAHKTEAGGVVLGLREPADIARAAGRLLGIAERVLVERMVDDAVAELLVGVNRDPQFGPFLVLGSGGVLVELLEDFRTLLLPTTAAEVRGALASLHLSPLLRGYRGRPAGDVEAAVGAVLDLAGFVEAQRNGIEELEINPLMVRPEGRGVAAIDVLLRLVEGGEGDD